PRRRGREQSAAGFWLLPPLAGEGWDGGAPKARVGVLRQGPTRPSAPRRVSRAIKSGLQSKNDSHLICGLRSRASPAAEIPRWRRERAATHLEDASRVVPAAVCQADQDRKSTRLNSSHVKISYAVFC